MAGTAPHKARKVKRSKPRTPETSGDEASSEDNAPVPAPRYVPAGIPSPSGNMRKRARVESPTQAAGQPLQRGAERAVKAIPLRQASDPKQLGDDARKRKRHEAVPPAHAFELAPSPDVSRAEPILGHLPSFDRGATPIYQTAGIPGPFSMQPPYVAHNAYSGPAYQPPFYPQHAYGQQNWPPMNPNPNNVPQWPPGNPYSQDEIDPYTGMRRGGYGGGPQF